MQKHLISLIAGISVLVLTTATSWATEAPASAAVTPPPPAAVSAPVGVTPPNEAAKLKKLAKVKKAKPKVARKIPLPPRRPVLDADKDFLKWGFEHTPAIPQEAVVVKVPPAAPATPAVGMADKTASRTLPAPPAPATPAQQAKLEPTAMPVIVPVVPKTPTPTEQAEMPVPVDGPPEAPPTTPVLPVLPLTPLGSLKGYDEKQVKKFQNDMAQAKLGLEKAKLVAEKKLAAEEKRARIEFKNEQDDNGWAGKIYASDLPKQTIGHYEDKMVRAVKMSSAPDGLVVLETWSVHRSTEDHRDPQMFFLDGTAAQLTIRMGRSVITLDSCFNQPGSVVEGHVISDRYDTADKCTVELLGDIRPDLATPAPVAKAN